ncbi:MAG: UbiA family prenyltransferase [Anaerolineae bacterium]|nr:UbiA family prenyltransferase [Anaerolineae bacterium]
MRPTNSLPATGLVLLGAYLASGWPWPRATWIAAGAMWAITSFGYVTNDLHDVEADRVNKPDRPLPSGRVRPSSARLAAAVLAGLAIGLASAIDGLAVSAAILALLLLVLYNVCLKSTVLLGNALVAILSGMALGVGSYTVGEPWALVWPGVLVSLFILAREILKTIEDVVGDRRAGVRTVATEWGVRCAGQLFAGVVMCFAVLSLAPLYGGLTVRRGAGLSIPYLTMVLVIDVGLAYSALVVGRAPTPANARVGLRISKVGYALGLLALLMA